MTKSVRYFLLHDEIYEQKVAHFNVNSVLLRNCSLRVPFVLTDVPPVKLHFMCEM